MMQLGKTYLLQNGMIVTIMNYENQHSGSMPYESDGIYKDDSFGNGNHIWFSTMGRPNYNNCQQYTAVREVTKEKDPEVFL